MVVNVPKSNRSNAKDSITFIRTQKYPEGKYPPGVPNRYPDAINLNIIT